MKKILVIIGICYMLPVNAQNYLITFDGIGASSTVNSVKVENLMAGTTLTLNGNDVLHLTGTTGIYSLENKQSSEIKIYPNPMTQNSLMEVYPHVAGDAVITVYDMTGRKLYQKWSYLENCLNEFRLSGFKDGLFLISVTGNNYQISKQLLCSVKSSGTINIEKVSNNLLSAVREKSEVENKGIGSTIDMLYTTGDRLKFTSISGIYSTVMMDVPTASKTLTFTFIACTDGDANNYPVVQIGTQTWMGENLKTSKYRNGDLIGTTTTPTLNISGESTPKYQWAYEGNENNVAGYGRLYTWYAVTDSRNVCPTGWHVPTDAEWIILTDYLVNNGYGYQGSGIDIAKSLAARSGWTASAIAGTAGNDQASNNSSGFTALPGGNRYSSGPFGGLGDYGFWRSSTEYEYGGGGSSYTRVIWYDKNYVERSEIAVKDNGFSVRCLKDN